MGGRGKECVVRCSAVEWSRGERKREEKRREEKGREEGRRKIREEKRPFVHPIPHMHGTV
jgi:hypothetical protein